MLPISTMLLILLVLLVISALSTRPYSRWMIAMPVLASMTLLSSAAAPTAQVPHSECACPSRLDYLVLASMADAPSLLAMSAYQAPPMVSRHLASRIP